MYSLFSWKDVASIRSLRESLGGTGLSPNSLSWLPSSRLVGCCSVLSERPAERRRTTIATSRPISKNHRGPRKLEVSADAVVADFLISWRNDVKRFDLLANMLICWSSWPKVAWHQQFFVFPASSSKWNRNFYVLYIYFALHLTIWFDSDSEGYKLTLINHD